MSSSAVLTCSCLGLIAVPANANSSFIVGVMITGAAVELVMGWDIAFSLIVVCDISCMYLIIVIKPPPPLFVRFGGSMENNSLYPYIAL